MITKAGVRLVFGICFVVLLLFTLLLVLIHDPGLLTEQFREFYFDSSLVDIFLIFEVLSFIICVWPGIVMVPSVALSSFIWITIYVIIKGFWFKPDDNVSIILFTCYSVLGVSSFLPLMHLCWVTWKEAREGPDKISRFLFSRVDEQDQTSLQRDLLSLNDWRDDEVDNKKNIFWKYR